MLSFNNLIEIGQDAAGVIEAGVPQKAQGFYTAGVETCLVTIWVGEMGTILLHDSAQLKLSEINAFLKTYGPMSKVVVLHRRPTCPSYATHFKRHQDRLMEILGAVRVNYKNRTTVEVPHPTFVVKCDLAGNYEVLPQQLLAVDAPRIDQQTKRQAVANVNNFFLERDARTLSLDVQYHKGTYAPIRPFDKSLEQLLAVVKDSEQAAYFFQNIAVLHDAHRLGLLALPASLLELVSKYDLSRLVTSSPTQEDLRSQADEFKRYIRSPQRALA